MTDRSGELKARVSAKQKELEAKLEKLKADVQGKSNDEIEKTEKKLEDLKGYLKDGWDNVTESVVNQLNEWLK